MAYDPPLLSQLSFLLVELSEECLKLSELAAASRIARPSRSVTKDCLSGFKPCKVTLNPPAGCDPLAPWTAEIHPCPPKPLPRSPKQNNSFYDPPECTRPGCKHWRPKGGPCLYDDPCKAHCFNHTPGMKPSLRWESDGCKSLLGCPNSQTRFLHLVNFYPFQLAISTLCKHQFAVFTQIILLSIRNRNVAIHKVGIYAECKCRPLNRNLSSFIGVEKNSIYF